MSHGRSQTGVDARVLSAASAAPDLALALAEVSSALLQQAAGSTIRGVFLYATVQHDQQALRAILSESLPDVAVLGCTSCLGVGSPAGFHSGPALAAMALVGDGFRVGSDCTDKGDVDPEALGRRLATQALRRGNIAATAARFAVLHATPGDEEAILRGIYAVLDRRVPVLGGSAADNDLSGHWGVWSERDGSTCGAALAVCDWPWKLATAYTGGYVAAGPKGRVTRAEGRTLFAIDGQPAAQVYDRWTDGSIAHALPQGGAVLGATTMAPLGIARARFAGIDCYVLLHPERVAPDGSMRLFADVKEGDTVALMTSSRRALVERAGRVAQSALRSSGLEAHDVAGALLIYCGGCLLAVQDDADAVMQSFTSTIGAPSVAVFTFGEVGNVVPRQIDHGNLMAGVLLLSTKR